MKKRVRVYFDIEIDSTDNLVELAIQDNLKEYLHKVIDKDCYRPLKDNPLCGIKTYWPVQTVRIPIEGEIAIVSIIRQERLDG